MRAGLLVTLILVFLFALFIAAVPATQQAAQTDVIVLSDNNTVSLALPIDATSASYVQKDLMNKDLALPKGKPIYLVLNSPGGYVDAGMGIIEMAKGLDRPVHTISMFSASMSFIISQKLDTRYVLESSTLMSHRVRSSGMGGEIPGSLQSRVDSLFNMTTEIDTAVSSRAGMSLPAYRERIANEMWISGAEAVASKFADKLISVKCDKSLAGYGAEQTVDVILFSVRVRFPKCPLITEPEVLMGNSEFVEVMVNNKPKFIKTYLDTGLLR